MLTDLIRNNAVALVAGTVMATASLGGGTVYVVYQDRNSAVEAGIQDETGVFPAKFVLKYEGTMGYKTYGNTFTSKDYRKEYIQGSQTFFCDTSVEVDGRCKLKINARGEVKVYWDIYYLIPHAGDKSRVKLQGDYKEAMSGITWEQLQRGVSYGDGVWTAVPYKPTKDAGR